VDAILADQAGDQTAQIASGSIHGHQPG